MEGRARKLGRDLLSLAPPLTGALLVLATATPLYMGHVGEIAPQLGVAAVFFWTVHRPDLMTFGAAFGIGLVADLATGAPLGMSALILIVLRRVVLAWRRFFVGKPFHVLWLGFALAAFPAALAGWSIASVYLFEALDIVRALTQAVFTVVLFPPVAWLLARCRDLLPAPRSPAFDPG